MAGESKQRIEDVAADLLARRGFGGMGLKAISEAAGLPFGSIYHHFPGGKEEIAAAAIVKVGGVLEELLAALFAGGVDGPSLRSLFDFMGARLEGSDWSDGCPVGTPAQDGSAESEAVRRACDDALGRMVDAVAAALVADGHAPAAAQGLALTIISAYEGATILARAQRSTAPLQAAGEAMVTLVRSASRA